MKNLLTIIFLLTTMLSFGQTDLLAMNTSKIYFINTNYSHENKIDLRLPIKKYHDPSDKSSAIAILIGGVAFVTAAILEGDGNYGTWKANPNSTSKYNQTYTTKPFMEQTPRQIMLFVGIGLTITGGALTIR